MAAPAKTMETYVLVRPMPRVGATSREEIKALAQKSNDAICVCHDKHADHHIKWIQTFLTDDASYCVYKASSPEVLQEHAARVGIPAGDILPVRHIVQPSTATETTPAEAAAMAADPGYGTERPLAQRQAAAHLGQ